MDSMIHRWYPFLGVQLQIFVLWQFHSGLGEEVTQAMMSELPGVVLLHGPKWYGGVVIVILLH